MKLLKPHDNEDFKKQVIIDYLKSTEHKNQSVDINDFLNYLIQINLLPEKHRFHFLVFKKYEALKSQGIKKTDAVYQIADNFNVHENTIWNILKRIYI